MGKVLPMSPVYGVTYVSGCTKIGTLTSILSREQRGRGKFSPQCEKQEDVPVGL
jgi:hypothetical protein